MLGNLLGWLLGVMMDVWDEITAERPRRRKHMTTVLPPPSRRRRRWLRGMILTPPPAPAEPRWRVPVASVPGHANGVVLVARAQIAHAGRAHGVDNDAAYDNDLLMLLAMFDFDEAA